MQWNPVNTSTVQPEYFGCINEVVVLTGYFTFYGVFLGQKRRHDNNDNAYLKCCNFLLYSLSVLIIGLQSRS